MQEQLLYEYAVIRVVPQVEREEFLNVGVVLYCPKQKFLQSTFLLQPERLTAFCSTLDIALLDAYLHAFQGICAGGKDTGPIGKLPVAERFRWLAATRSTIMQTSKIHSGFCADPLAKLTQLYEQLVLY